MLDTMNLLAIYFYLNQKCVGHYCSDKLGKIEVIQRGCQEVIYGVYSQRRSIDLFAVWFEENKKRGDNCV